MNVAGSRLHVIKILLLIIMTYLNDIELKLQSDEDEDMEDGDDMDDMEEDEDMEDDDEDDDEGEDMEDDDEMEDEEEF